MKKIYSFLFAATALFAASSCQKEVAPEVEAPEFEKITFTASTEVDTKTALHDGKSTIWVAGDQISVFDANKEANNRCFNIDKLSEDAKTATFSYEGEFVKDNTQADPTVVAFYPYQAKAYCDFFYYDRNYITGLNFPSEQTAVAGGFDPKAGFALGLGTMGTMEIGFQNLYALLKFTVRDAGVKKVTVKVDGENAFIAGDAKIQMTLNTEKIGSTEPVFESPVLSIVENGSNTVTLSCEAGFDTEATYYIAVVPTTFTGISLYCDDVLVNEKKATMTLEANKIYNLKDNGSAKKERNLAFATAQYTATLGKSFTAPQVSGVTEGVEYTSSDEAIAAVDPTSGAVTLKKAGTVTITAAAAESRYYLAGEASYTLTISKQARNLKFSASTAEGVVGKDLTEPALSGVQDGVVYESSNTSVATVDKSGVVTMKAAGTTVITAKAGETEVYLAGEASYELTVTPDKVRLYVDCSKLSKAYIYSWTAADEFHSGEWPGTEMKWDSNAKKYYYEFDVDLYGQTLNYIINNGVSQTADLTIELSQYEVTTAKVPVLYLKPNSNWKVDNARFAAYFFGNGDGWASMQSFGSEDLYEVIYNPKFTKVIFCRMNPSTTENKWDNKWNQTGDLTIPTNGNNLFTVLTNTWDGATTTWGKKTF